MRKRSKSQTSVRSRLMRVQMILVVPLIIVIILSTLYFLNSFFTAKLDNARFYSLQTAAGSFDDLYNRCRKLLQIPYTEEDILHVLSAEADPHRNPKGRSERKRSGVVFNALYPKILFYEPNISSVTLVSEGSGRVLYSRQYPTRSINGHNADWEDLRQSAWYRNTVTVDEPVVGQAIENELYTGSGITLSLSQRLIDPSLGQRIGVIRIDLNLTTLYEDWKNMLEKEGDIFAVSDHTGQLVFSNSPDFLQEYPLLSPAAPSLWRQNYHLNQYAAADSGFTFYYLGDPTALSFHTWLIYGIPLLAALLCGAYAGLLIHWSSKSISHPIQKLKTAMLQGQRKDISVRCEPLEGELGELGEAFNDLMDQVGELVREVAAREQERAKLDYEALQSKIAPHFLYNTINAIRWRADILGAREVANALEGLASLLRFTIKSTDDLVPFSVELEQLENYIQIMRVRYGNEIDISFDIDERCFGYLCLKFLFQPAVENCFTHAFASDGHKDKTILITAAWEPACIRVSVEDNGDGMTARQIEEIGKAGKNKTVFTGIGLGSIRQRIKTLFGDGFDMKIESEPGRFTKVTACIPLNERKENEI